VLVRFSDKFNSWEILNNGGNGWKVETPPFGLSQEAQPLPDDTIPSYWTKSKHKAPAQ
jgi:hypothetical protein